MANQSIRVVDKVFVEAAGGKDGWDIFSIIISALVPIMVVLVGHWFSEQQKQANEIAKQADRLSVLIEHLASENPKERKIAVDVSNYLAENGQLPKELIPALIDIADTEESSDVAKAASYVLAKVEETEPKLKEQIQQSAANIRPRVYFHINKKSQRESANKLASQLVTELEAINLTVPGVERRRGPSNTQFRFFKSEEKNEPEKIVSALQKLGLSVEPSDLSSKYQNSKNIRPRHYELWLGDDFK